MLVKELAKQDFGGAQRYKSVTQRQAHAQLLFDGLLEALPELARKAPSKMDHKANLVFISKRAKQHAPALRALLGKRLSSLNMAPKSDPNIAACAADATGAVAERRPARNILAPKHNFEEALNREVLLHKSHDATTNTTAETPPTITIMRCRDGSTLARSTEEAQQRESTVLAD
jgi:hypothetical protein